MHLIKKALAFAAISCAVAANAQERFFTIAEATNGMSTTLAPAAISQGSWQPNTEHFYYATPTGWVREIFNDRRTDTILRLKDINERIIKDGKLKKMPLMGWTGENRFYFVDGNNLYRGSFVEGENWEKTQLPEGFENLKSCAATGDYAYTVGNNLKLARFPLMLYNKETIDVTNDADKNIVNGKPVHRDEFGITTGVFFSPKGNKLAYYRMDQTMVADYPVIDWSVTPAVNSNIKYPMAGGTSHEVTLCVFDPVTKKTVVLKTGTPKDHYLTCVTWSPDEKFIYIALLNREQNHLQLKQYDANTGEELKTLFEEKDPKYVHPEHELKFIPGSNDQFIWWSERDGFEHLYLYNTSGKMLKQLTRGAWNVNELLGCNAQSKELIYTSSQESALEKHVYAVNYTNGKIRKLDGEAGMHTATCSENGALVFDVFNGAGIPKKSVVRNVQTGIVETLVDAPNTLKDFKRPSIQNVTLKADDGTPLYGKLILPVNFDENKKYPVIVYLYNGPNVQLIHNQFPESGNLWYEYMAQHGYIVFTMDGRGSANRGMKFEQATFRKLGTVELEDQMKGVAYLKSLKYVDPARMGIHGWSYGGFMTTSMMLRNPGVFKCAVAGGPVMDWKMYEVMYTERYMDTPAENAEGYAASELYGKVKNLQGKLLLIHGAQDDVVVWQHSLNFIKKCVDEGVQLDYFVYPGHPHNVRGKDRVHLMQKISDYFDLYLRP